MQQNVIAICGIKHSGKTAAAKTLARLLEWELVDTDDLLKQTFENRTGRSLSVRAIYQEMQEQLFRKWEAECVRNLPGTKSGRILSLGGGLLSNPFFTASDRASLGFICWLDTEDEVAFARIQQEGLPPFLQNEQEPFTAFQKMNEARKIIFREAAHGIVCPARNHTPEDTAKQILNLYQEKNDHE